MRMRTYLAGKTKINWKKLYTWKYWTVNRVSEQSFHQCIHRFLICGFWEKYARQLQSIRIYKSKVNYVFTILWYTFSETISWAKNNKMGNKAAVSVLKPSQFSKAWIFPITSSFCQQKLVLKVSDIAQIIKKMFIFQGQNQMIHFTLFTFQMYSSSLRFQQKEPKNH